MSDDLVKRWDVFVYLTEYYNHRTELQHDCLKQALSRVPPAEPERKKGKWIDENGNEVPFFKGTTEPSKSCWCSNCKEWLTASDEYSVEGAFCPSCGADMRTKGTDYDYERAVEQLEHDMLYEPTFNQDDGSM